MRTLTYINPQIDRYIVYKLVKTPHLSSLATFTPFSKLTPPTRMSSSLSSRGRRFLVKPPVVVVDVGCSCRRRRSRLSSLFSSFSRSSTKPGKLTPVSLSSSASTTLTSSTCDVEYTSSYSPVKKKKKKKRVAVNESVAVVKESREPYVDFRESMVQMIVEEELYAWDDLNDLLHRFLSLNSPQHHHLILGAFADIWDGVFSRQG